MSINHQKKKERSYHTFNYPDSLPGSKTLLTGIRENAENEDEVFITGFYEPQGDPSDVISFVYKGDLSGNGSWFTLNYPSSPGVTVKTTNLYGPDSEDLTNCSCHSKKHHPKSSFRVVGNYTTVEVGTAAFGCLYEGPLDGSGTWTTLLPTSDEPVLNTIAHSTINGLVVGNYDTTLITGKAFIYDIKKKKYYDIVKPGAQSITAYGIWYNDDSDTYTICGGYTEIGVGVTKNQGYMVDWDNRIHEFSNWKSFSYGNDPVKSLVTHFDGITSDESGGYNLTGDRLEFGAANEVGFFANVKRKENGKFSEAKWESISFPGSSVTSGNSVYKKVVIGVYVEPDILGVNGYISCK